VTYDPATLRRARAEAWIAAAGPAVTLHRPRAAPDRETGASGATRVVLVLVPIIGISLWMDPVTALWLAGLFGVAVFMQKTYTRG
jgi:uncharacterized membrane protein